METQQSVANKGISIFLSFGAKTVQPEILEKMLVGRQKTVGLLEQYVREIAHNGVNHQVFIVGPRGSGKTHLLRVLYYRINALVQDQALIVAYFAEEEYGISDYLDYLIRIINAFKRWYDADREALEAQLNILRDTPEKSQEYIAESIISAYIGDKPLLILSENFDAILAALGKKGQAKLRGWLYRHNRISIIATSQAISPDMSREDRPFYGFFSNITLKKLTLDESLELLKTLAQLEQRNDIIDHLAGKGRAQVQAIYELVKGNHRLLVTFYEFLKADSLAELSVIFLKTMNDLKPYYETFIRFLPAQQQKVLHHLALSKMPQKGTDIAKNCFIATTSLTKQLSELQRQNLIDAITDPNDKRNKFYDVSEPLLRIAIEIGEQREGVTALFIDFLALYYSSEELHKQKIHFESRYLAEDEPLLKQKMYYETEARERALQLKSSLNSDFTELTQQQVEQIPQNDNDYVLVGNDLYNQRRYEKAIEAFQQAIAIQQNNAGAWNNLGNTYDSLEQYKRAIDAFQKAIAIQPDYADAWYNLGSTYDRLKQYEKAIKAFQKAIAIQPDFAGAWNNLGTTYGKTEQYERAIKAFQRSIAIQPDRAGVWSNLGITYGNLKQYERASEAYQQAITVRSDADTWYNLGITYDNLEQCKQATEAFQNAIAIQPDYADAWYNLGTVYSKTNQYELAIEAYRKTITIQPGHADAWNNLGNAYDHMKQYGQVINAYQQAIAIQPSAVTWYNLGSTYGNLEQYELAIEAYQQAIAIQPDYANAWNNLGTTHFRTNQYERAIEAYQQATTIQPDYAIAWLSLGITYGKINQYELAIEAYQQAIAIQPDYANAWNNLGTTYGKTEQYERAIEAFQKAIAVQPDYANAWSNLGTAYGKTEQYERAVEAFQKAITVRSDAVVWYNLGNMYNSLKQYERASEAYQQAIAIQPNADTWYNLGVTYDRLEQYEKAIEAFQKSVAVQPDADTWYNLGVIYDGLKQHERAIEAYQKGTNLSSTSSPIINRLVESITNYLQTQTTTQEKLSNLEDWLQNQPNDELKIITTYVGVYRRIVFDKDEKALIELPKEQRQFFEREILNKPV